MSTHRALSMTDTGADQCAIFWAKLVVNEKNKKRAYVR